MADEQVALYAFAGALAGGTLSFIGTVVAARIPQTSIVVSSLSLAARIDRHAARSSSSACCSRTLLTDDQTGRSGSFWREDDPMKRVLLVLAALFLVTSG